MENRTLWTLYENGAGKGMRVTARILKSTSSRSRWPYSVAFHKYHKPGELMTGYDLIGHFKYITLFMWLSMVNFVFDLLESSAM